MYHTGADIVDVFLETEAAMRNETQALSVHVNWLTVWNWSVEESVS